MKDKRDILTFENLLLAIGAMFALCIVLAFVFPAKGKSHYQNLSGKEWPGGKCIVCFKEMANHCVVRERSEDGWSSGIMVACDACWQRLSMQERVDYAEQVMLGYFGSEPWPESNRVAQLKAILEEKQE